MLRPSALFFLLLLCTGSYATRYHVQASASGNATGLTWANAFTDLQEALSVVIPGDEIWVAAGQYKPTSGTSRAVAFNMRNGVSVFGGFSGVETVLEQRDIAANPTVLNGDIGQLGTNSDNSYTLVTVNQLTSPITLDGFRIMNGYSAGGSGYNGAGMRVTNTLGGLLVVRNCSFVNNYSGTYGGGIYLATAKLTIENCDFINNSAGSGDGGAIHNGNNNGGPTSVLTIRDSRFTNNSARQGACLYNTIAYDTLLIDRCIFTNNTSEYSVLRISGFHNVRVFNSSIIGNTVNGSSSNVLYVNASLPGQLFSMINCTVAQNFNIHSGSLQSEALKFFDTEHVIQNSIIYGNTPYSGRQVSANPIISNSIVQGGHTNGTDIIDQDPLFVMPSPATATNFDASLFDYTLLPSSPGINVGNNDLVDALSLLDLAGNDRIQGGVVDLGCYESILFLSAAERRTLNTTWYFDALHNELRLMKAATNVPVEILDLSGRTVLRFVMTGNTTRIDLPAGAYLATSIGNTALRFVVAD